MSMPRIPLPLPETEPRCCAVQCPRSTHCARYWATVGRAAMMDYSIVTGWTADQCAGWISEEALRKPPPDPAPRPVRPFPSGDGE